jgi:hypothetical protein
MSENPNQESAPIDHTPPSQEAGSIDSIAPVQESFGPPFPEVPSDALAPNAYHVPPLSVDSKQPGEAPSDARQPQVAYTSPHFYNPPPGYGYALPPQAVYGQPFQVPPASPLPLGTAIRQLPRQYWRVLTHPKASTFVEEQGKAAWNIIWIQLLFLGVVQALAILALVFLEFFLIQAFVPNSNLSSISQTFPLVGIVIVIFSIVCAPIPFFAASGIYHLIAKAFGGSGSFLSYCYNYALITIPIGILSVVLSLVPCVGSIAGLAGAVYEVILLIYMTMGVHRLSGGKASATVLIPVITATVLVVGLYAAYFIWIFSVMSTLQH